MKYHQWFLPWYHDLITPEKRMEFIEYNTMMVQGWFHYHALAQSTVSQCFLRIRQTAPRERGPGKCRSCWIKERISFGRRSSWACYESMNLKKRCTVKKKHPCSPKARRPWWRFCSKVSRWIPFRSSKCLQVPGLSQLQPLVSKRIQQLDISPGNPTQFDTWPSFVYQLTYCILDWLKMLWIFSQWTINYLGNQKGAGPFQLQ